MKPDSLQRQRAALEAPEPTAPRHGGPGSTALVAASGAVPGPPGRAPTGLMRMDLHCHSEASHDGLTPLAAFEARCLARGIGVQAITDHNEVWGAQKLCCMLDAKPGGSALTVIVGEEVSTRDGEIVGLFLTERIDKGLTPEETVRRIKGQGGLVLLPHGFDPLKRARLTPQALERVAHEIDIVEAFNARISRPSWNRAAAAWADERRLPKSSGSDAHILADVGDAWVETPVRPIRGPDDLLAALRDGTVMGEWTHPAIAYATKMWHTARTRAAGVRRASRGGSR